MSNIVCQKCRRLVRKSNINYSEGDYYCPKCQTSYKLPASYYKKGELSIPILPKKTDLKVIKSEAELLIELPMHIFTIGFIISTCFIAFLAFILVGGLIGKETEMVLSYSLFFGGIFLLTLVYAMSKKSIIVKGDAITFRKKMLGLKFDDTEKLKKVTRIRQIEVESDSENGQYISSRFVEVYFSRDHSWEFGHNLDKADREYIIAELKLYHFYTNVL